MLRKLEIRNFQVHRKLDIEFDPFVTMICGKSDSGKSSIIRALRWIILNRPSGDGFIRHGTDDCSVTLSFDSMILNRKRGKGINRYMANGKEFVAFGNDIPEEISKACNLSDINFQLQHDSPFWFAQSGGEVSRQLNAIINLDCIDSTLANLNSRIRETTTKISICEQRRDKAKEDRKTHMIAALMDESLKEVEQSSQQASLLRTKATELDDLVKTGARTKKKIIVAYNASQVASRIVKLGEDYERVFLLRQFVSTLAKEGRRLSKIKMPKGIIEKLAALEVLDSKARISEERAKALNDLAGTIWQIKESTDVLKVRAETSQREFKKQMGDACPLCERKL